MKNNYTDIIIVLDRSGSMRGIQKDTIGGVNKFIADQKTVPGEATFSLFQFDHEYEAVSKAVPIRDAKELTEETYVPRGNTCLLGAIGCAIRDVGDRLKALPEDQRPEKVIFVIVTDGEENSSHKCEWSSAHNATTVKDAIDRQTAAYKWQFVYIGANQDAFTNASNLGIPAAHAMNYTANKAGTEKLYGDMGQNVRSMRMNMRRDMAWTDSQLKAQADAAK